MINKITGSLRSIKLPAVLATRFFVICVTHPLPSIDGHLPLGSSELAVHHISAAYWATDVSCSENLNLIYNLFYQSHIDKVTFEPPSSNVSLSMSLTNGRGLLISNELSSLASSPTASWPIGNSDKIRSSSPDCFTNCFLIFFGVIAAKASESLFRPKGPFDMVARLQLANELQLFNWSKVRR